MGDTALLTHLSMEPVLGVAMGQVSVLRLDRTGGLAPGNKAFKLRGNLEAARRRGVSRLVSFGGAWSNHLHALAAVGAATGMETVGIVRGEKSTADTAMLEDARSWGMDLHHVSRGEYRKRNDPDYLRQLERRFHPCLVIPEGGANTDGARGCMAIAGVAADSIPGGARYVLPVGTGTTLAGLVAGLPAGNEVIGISALKGATDLELRVEQGLQACGALSSHCQWQILHDFHCGGFARTHTELREFILAFQHVHQMALEPVYTGKALFAIYQMLKSGAWGPDRPLVAVHTGGLQGRRGYPWLDTR